MSEKGRGLDHYIQCSTTGEVEVMKKVTRTNNADLEEGTSSTVPVVLGGRG